MASLQTIPSSPSRINLTSQVVLRSPSTIEPYDGDLGHDTFERNFDQTFDGNSNFQLISTQASPNPFCYTSLSPCFPEHYGSPEVAHLDSGSAYPLVSSFSLISTPQQVSSSGSIARELTARRVTSPYLKIDIPPEDCSFTFFQNFYIQPKRDPLARRGFLEHLSPIYTRTDPTPPFMLATMAAASCLLSIHNGHDPYTQFTTSYYLRAVRAMHNATQQACYTDEMLISVLLLQLFEVIRFILVSLLCIG